MSDWIKTAKVGDDVVCTKLDAWFAVTEGRDNEGIFPEYGEIYVIGFIDAIEDKVFLGLVGIDGWYWSEHFRPVEKRPTDISSLTALLKSAPAPVEEMA
jgi:hypothetical protein